MSSHKASLVMSRAWKLAREGQTIYGGSVKSYLAEALRLSWAELNVDPVQKAVDELIAFNRANRAAGRHSAAAPYSVRKFGNPAITRWYAGQSSQIQPAQ